MMRMICLRPQPPAPATHRQAFTPIRDGHSTCKCGSLHNSYLRSHRSSRTARPRGSSPSATSAPPCQTAAAAEVRHIRQLATGTQACPSHPPPHPGAFECSTVIHQVVAAAHRGHGADGGSDGGAPHHSRALQPHGTPEALQQTRTHNSEPQSGLPSSLVLYPPVLPACLPASLTDDGADEREPLHGAHEEGRVVVARAGARQTGQEHQAREEDALLAATTTSTPEAGQVRC